MWLKKYYKSTTPAIGKDTTERSQIVIVLSLRKDNTHLSHGSLQLTQSYHGLLALINPLLVKPVNLGGC